WIEDCCLSGFLANIIYIDLVGLAEQQAEDKLLQEVQAAVVVRNLAPQFPVTSHPIYPPSLPRYWHVPLTRKPLFTGRDSLLDDIANGFSSATGQVLQALTGMGGAGKT